MKKYLGMEVVHAKPMNSIDFKRSTGRIISISDLEVDGYVVYEPGIAESFGKRWMEKIEFESKYKALNSSLSFGNAIEALKRGMKVARRGWNGKNMHLTLIPQTQNEAVMDADGDAYSIADGYDRDMIILPWIGMKNATDEFVPWLASQTDMLSEDWEIVE